MCDQQWREKSDTHVLHSPPAIYTPQTLPNPLCCCVASFISFHTDPFPFFILLSSLPKRCRLLWRITEEELRSDGPPSPTVSRSVIGIFRRMIPTPAPTPPSEGTAPRRKIPPTGKTPAKLRFRAPSKAL